MPATCIFCKIVSKEIPALFIAENEHIIVLKDIAPKAPIHFLIIPKVHTDSINALTDDDVQIAGKILLMARDLAKQNDITSFRLIANTGKHSGQSVFHTHMHFLSGKQMIDF